MSAIPKTKLDVERLIQTASPEEILEVGRACVETGAIGKAVAIIQHFTRTNKHAKAIELSNFLYKKEGSARNLNQYVSAIHDSRDRSVLVKELKWIVPLIQGHTIEYDIHLLSTVLRCLREIQDRDTVLAIFTDIVNAEDKRNNPYVVVQYLHVLFEKGKYDDIILYYKTLTPAAAKDDYVKKLRAWAILRNGDIETADEIIRVSRNDRLKKLITTEIKARKEKLGMPNEPDDLPPDAGRPRVFIVHGHDKAMVEAVKATLYKLRADPVDFDALKKGGAETIAEILEKHVPVVNAVVVILTPDDEGRKRGSSDPLVARSRQNVLVEGGYAVIAKRKFSVLIITTGVEVPSDFHGIHYIQVEREWTPKNAGDLAKRLKAMGLSVDSDALL